MTQSYINLIKIQFKDISDIVYKSFHIYNHSCVIAYIPSIVDNDVLRDYITRNLVNEKTSNWSNFVISLNKGEAFNIPYEQVKSANEAASLITCGNVILIFDDHPTMYAFNIVRYSTRTVTESQNEMVIIGPQEAFIEDIQINLSLLRHRIKHTDLKVREYQVGKYTKSKIYIIFVEGLYKPEVLEDIEQRIKHIKIDGIFGVTYLVEFLNTKNFPFPILQYTEKPDILAASLLEGRIGIMMDGSPTSIITPVTLISLLQSAEDYYQNYFTASWIRIIRFLFSILSIFLPAIYVALTTFHPQVIPSDLLVTITAARENIPFTSLTEAFIMEITFEALREAGMRIPKPIGQTVSIIGGIVIGQAAVQAGIVSAPMVIVVSVTGVASYIIPHLELNLIFRLLRFPLLLLGGIMGLIGVYIGGFLLFAYMVSLKSFGTPYLQPIAPLVLADWKDGLFRFPHRSSKRKTDAFARKRSLWKEKDK